MQDPPSTKRDPDPTADIGGWRSLGRLALFLALTVFGVFYMMLAMGGASFIHECQTLVCGQLHQAVFAAIGALALFVGAYRLFEGKSLTAAIVLVGTLPILVVHVLLVITDPNEAVFFPLSTTPPPLISGAILVNRAMIRKRNAAEQL